VTTVLSSFFAVGLVLFIFNFGYSIIGWTVNTGVHAKRNKRNNVYRLYTFVATVLLVNGAGYVIAGITGAVYVPIGLNIVRRGRNFWESDAA
jgi:hypothetical protein